MTSQQLSVPKTSRHVAKLVTRLGFPSSNRTLARIPPNKNDPNGYYEFLGVDPAASLEVIKAHYRAWARLWHPEGEAPDEENWLYLTHIYKILSNPETRKEYDETIGTYISAWEMKQAMDSTPDLIQGLHTEEEALEKKMQEERPEPIVGYSFWCMDDIHYEEEAQEWYPFVLEAMGLFKIDMPVQVGVGRINKPFQMQVLPSRRLVWWFDDTTPPNFFTAYAAIYHYAVN
jgi:hypothetical protein